MNSTSVVSTLLEALPYIREFHGKTVVIKYGGAAMEDPQLREEFARDVVLLKYVGMNPIVVHGGGPDITRYMQRLNMPVEFVGGLRVSDEDTVEIAKMVLVGKVNKDIVLRLGRHGQPAVGLCGDDGMLFRVDTMEGPAGEDIGLVGRIERVDAGVIHHVAEDYIPVIASVGADRDGRSHNVNADEAAGAVARALGAYKVMFLTDVAGWLSDPADPGSVISETTADDVEAALRTRPGRDAAEARGVPERDPRRRRLRAHHRRAAAALAAARAVHRRGDRHEGAARRDERADGELRAVPGRVRARGGRAAVGRRRRGVPRLPGRDLGLQHRPLPSGRRRGDPRAGRRADPRLEPVHDPRRWRDLAERLSASSLGGKVLFGNSGAEANEAALKLVRKAKPGGDIVVVHGAFHGRTYGALSATPQESKQAPFAPLVPGFIPVAPDPEALDAAVTDRTAAVLLEPIQGETGVHELPAELLRAARAACDRSRRRARLRRGPDRPRAAPARCGRTSGPASCPTR